MLRTEVDHEALAGAFVPVLACAGQDFAPIPDFSHDELIVLSRSSHGTAGPSA